MATEPPNPSGSQYIRNWLSLTGLVIAIGSLFAFLLLFVIDLFAQHANPYMGILAYLVAPGFLFLGLFLTGLGVWIERRHRRRVSPQQAPHALTIDLSRPRDKKMLAGFVAVSAVFLLLTAHGSTTTNYYTDSLT